jgi:TPR repeat protein
MDKLTPELEEGLAAYERQDYVKAFSLLLPLAEAGNARAQCHVAALYHAGNGVGADGTQAVHWYLRAAEQNDKLENISGTAYHNLAVLFITGMPTIPVDRQRAQEYLRKAAELGVHLVPPSWRESAEENRLAKSGEAGT